jgi:hypothetical protein
MSAAMTNFGWALLLTLLVGVIAPVSVSAAVPSSTSVTMVVANETTFGVTWNAVPTAASYYLWVTDSAGVVQHQVWYTPTQSGCDGGLATCGKVLALRLRPGPIYVWVQTWNPDGFGAWSEEYRTRVAYDSLRVYDANGTFLGVLFSQNEMLSEYNGTPMIFEISARGVLGIGVTLLYGTSDCSGPSYIASDRLPVKPQLTDTHAYIPAGPQLDDFVVRGTRGAGNASPCVQPAPRSESVADYIVVPLSSIFDTRSPPLRLVR